VGDDGDSGGDGAGEEAVSLRTLAIYCDFGYEYPAHLLVFLIGFTYVFSPALQSNAIASYSIMSISQRCIT
jgi:hypothetical protein